jgi:pyridinium-3,5-biscarboxylic acid mononucleotide synthase
MSAAEIKPDFARPRRIGLEEAVYCAGKSAVQIEAILDMAALQGASLLMTRLDRAKFEDLPERQRERIDYCAVSRTGYFGEPHPVAAVSHVAILAAGTSDVPVAREAERTLRYHGQASVFIADVGVAGLWRLTSRIDEIRAFPLLIVAAGMDAALPSVVGGLVPGAVIAVPTSVGYGVAAGGRAALDAMLASCAPGITVCNIDNGYGAACAALRLMHAFRMARACARASGTGSNRLGPEHAPPVKS